MGDALDAHIQMREDVLDTLYEYGGLKRCSICGEEGLSWYQTDKGTYQLGKNNRFHECPGKICSRCGERGLSWMETDKGWRLSKHGKIHSC